jgi:ABC-type branched-subunit amino acid transport system substrate-binding protein
VLSAKFGEMMTTARVIAAFLAVLYSVLAPGASLSETGVGEQEVLIGTANPTSGPSAFYGIQSKIGVSALVNGINDQGGVYGRKIRVLFEDDKYDAQVAITCFQHWLSHGVFGITALGGSAIAAKYIPMCMLNKMPAVGFYSGPTFIYEPVKRYVFNARSTLRDETMQAFEHLWKDLGVGKVAIIYQNDSYGADCLEALKLALQKHGAELVAAAAYTRNVNKVEEAVSIVKAANPEAVFIAAVYQPAAEVLKIAHEGGWKPLFVLNSGCSMNALLEQSGQLLEGQVFTDVVPLCNRIDLPLIVKYRADLQKYFPNEKPNVGSLRAYLNAYVFAQGLKRAGKDLTREKFVDALERIHNLDVGLKDMRLNYSSTNHVGFNKVFFVTCKDGEFLAIVDWKKQVHLR